MEDGAMLTAAGTYASGDWIVKEGREQEFVARWQEFLDWTKADAAGLRRAVLIRDSENPQHFISFAEWESPDAPGAWRSLPPFVEKLGNCRALCEKFRGSDYGLAAFVGASASSST